MTERRKTDPRTKVLDARWGDRRDSPRVAMKFLVREKGEEGAYEERDGDLSLGGIHWVGKTAPLGKDVEVRFRLPGVAREIRTDGEIIRLSSTEGKQIGFHVRFTELDLPDELSIARFLDDES